ncbi:MAG: FG-GAP-like repeat-containing protein [Phycisphaerales bacterium]
MRRLCIRIATVAAVVFSGTAHATWSILLVDFSTGEVAVGSATCLTGFDLQANTPVLIPGVGAATAQSFVDLDGFNRTFIRDGLARGLTPGEVLAGLEVFDAGHETRQYGVVDTAGGLLTFSGLQAGAWAGGVTGTLPGAGVTGGDIGYAIQGNVLTGEPVVLGALQAIRDEPGDLPAKLMAGMIAARSLGGDGRCSCPTLGPTGCGETVEDPLKSSDIAYMLVARDGDREGCSPTYRTDQVLGDIEVVSRVNDRVLALSLETTNALELRRIEPIAAPAALQAAVRIPLPAPASEIEVGDLDGDGLADIVASAFDGSATWLLAADPAAPSGFAEPLDLGVAGQFSLVADLNADGRPDLVVADRVAGEVTVLRGTPTGLEQAASIAVPAVERVDVGDLNGDGLIDIACVSSSPAGLTVLTQHAGLSFSAAGLAPSIVPSPTLILVADADRDGALEVLLGGRTGPALETFDGSGTPDPFGQVFLPSRPRDLAVIDLNGDGQREVFVLGVAGSVALRPFFPGGPLVYDTEIPIFLQPLAVATDDLDGDGDPDLAVACQARNTTRLVENIEGGFPLTTGCGDGDFFLEFNVAFATRNDPDPVDQLEGLFSAWADELRGVPDAVRSEFRLPRPFLSSLADCESTVEILLRDRDGQPADAEELTVEAVGDSAATLAFAGAERTGFGRYLLSFRGTGDRGENAFIVRVRADRREVQLMPTLRLLADDRADLDGDGSVTAVDLDLWLTAYQTGDAAADQNGDGQVNPADYAAWIANARGRCGP